MTHASTHAPKGPGFAEFVCLIAIMMALNALAIDAMLPALPAIGADLGVANENSRQWIITAYLLGFGVTQLAYGPLSDRFGRKPVLLTGVSIYVAFSVLAAFSHSFELLILSRIGMGMGIAVTRVLAVSIVRDRYEGRTMARVMSLSFLVFLGVPIIAPTVGQLVLLVGPWQWIFWVFALSGSAFLIWAGLRLPETLHPEYRRPIQLSPILQAFGEALTNRQSMGYTLAITAIAGALFAFINSSQQVFFDVFGEPQMFALIFAGIAAGIAVASLLNSALVEKLGSRLISHSALIGFIGFSTLHAVIAVTGHDSLWMFSILQGLKMFCFGLTMGNFGSMAMEPMGRIAGTASSLQGFISTIGGAVLGFIIGQSFDGTTVPLTVGFSVLSIIALLLVLWAEQGKLFKSRHSSHKPVT
ncbi:MULTISPECIES: multidrug effflux MFS transporter [unclassified Brevundimonas]|uniref:multidrug effflux MFS transporter n=1 Tax=unclassified Brevundimonas TaxID=2622653 RepID=UPI0025C27361|nr:MULTISPECIES: multidrug effflux MFS transporter [unclassified Brevundimonas]